MNMLLSLFRSSDRSLENGRLPPPPVPGDVLARISEVGRYAEIKQLLGSLALAPLESRFLALVSFLPGEGRTLAALVLAVGFAEARKRRVLIVDGATHERPGSLSISKVLDSGAPEMTGLPIRKTKHELVDVLQLTDCREGEESHLKAALKSVAGNYELMVMDTSPLEAKNRNNIDPFLLARQADGCVLLVSQGLLGTPQTENFLSRLKDSRLKLMGVIENQEAAVK